MCRRAWANCLSLICSVGAGWDKPNEEKQRAENRASPAREELFRMRFKDEVIIFIHVHKGLDFGYVLEFDLNHPSFIVRILIDDGGMTL